MEMMVTVNTDADENGFLQAPVHSHCCRCPVALETTHPQWKVLTCLASFFLHLILPRMFRFVFSCPILFHPLPTTSNELCAIFFYSSPSPECSSSASSSLCTSKSSSSSSGSTMSSCSSGFFSWGPTSVVLSMECAGSTCFLDKHSLVQFCCTAVLELLLVLS